MTSLMGCREFPIDSDYSGKLLHDLCPITFSRASLIVANNSGFAGTHTFIMCRIISKSSIENVWDFLSILMWHHLSAIQLLGMCTFG